MRHLHRTIARTRGFTLLELMVVVAIVALASAGVGLAIRDNSQTLLTRDADRLAALLDAARAQSRASGVPVRWRVLPEGFRFEGLAGGNPPSQWLAADTVATPGAVLVLGPEPIIAPQEVRLASAQQPGQILRVATDGVRPFKVLPP
ncbi:prepilin-type N-terminal cleavage/methylation domain-containing protein [Variovorax sp. HJSM1_2]|uniref:prepilin-type N-terminal cleavage/methylation domain-containing protein n=1 Tax=Variovorax sp. HJSM1_2 TaxID=3366263 RepID=UPI003BDCF84B